MESDHLISNCSVFETYYNFVVENPDPKDLFQLTVTPRSNIIRARSGNTKEINALYMHLVDGKYNYAQYYKENLSISCSFCESFNYHDDIVLPRIKLSRSFNTTQYSR